VLSSFASPSTNPSGLAYDTSTGNLISCDINSDTIYIHDGVSSSVLSSFASPSTGPYGLTYDTSTGNLISCDTADNTIYVHFTSLQYIP
jgi:DNA-binding beta-propeller fold protein YncE